MPGGVSMVKGKKRQSEAKSEAKTPELISTTAVEITPSIKEYLLQFLVFVVFCLISAALIRLVTGYTLGLSFFFGVLILGFFVVCVFSYLHDRLYKDEEEAEGGP